MAAVLAVVSIFGAGTGCGPEPAPPTSPQPPLVVLAVDGLEWEVLLPLLRAGKLPHLRELMERGTWGRLETFRPTLSPVIWTTIATGKTPAQHGIEGFTLSGNKGNRLYQSGDRRTKAVWDITTDFKKRAAVLGWWASWPAEKINGVFVTQMSLTGLDVAKGGLLKQLPDQVSPAIREMMVERIRSEVEGSTDALIAEACGLDPSDLGPLETRLFEHCLWSLRADETYARIAESLLGEAEDFAFLAVYLGSPDVVGHRFWRYREPARFVATPDAEVLESCGRLIERNAEWIDQWVGRLCAAAGDNANIMVLSDHGMHATGLDDTYSHDAPMAELNSGHHMDAPPGVLIAAGPSVRASGRGAEEAPLIAGTIYDVLPTWLNWLDIPAGRDMRGRVAEQWISIEHLRATPPRRIASHDDAEWLERRARHSAEAPPEAELERLEQLSDLGYVGSEDGE